MQDTSDITTLDQSMDEALAVSFWDGTPVGSLVGQRRSRRKEKQFARMIEHQLRMMTERGLPMSRVMADLGSLGSELGSRNDQETQAEIVTSWKQLDTICKAISQGK